MDRLLWSIVFITILFCVAVSLLWLLLSVLHDILQCLHSMDRDLNRRVNIIAGMLETVKDILERMEPDKKGSQEK